MKRKIFSVLLIIFSSGFAQAANTAVTVKVEVQGVGGALKKNVLNSLSLKRYQKAPEFNEDIMKSLFDKAPAEIQKALQPFGFYSPKINNSLLKQNGTWHALFRINPGEPVRISKLDLRITGEGARQAPFENFIKTFPLKQGDVLNQQVYEKAKQNLQDIAANYGFLKASLVRHQVLVYPGRRQARLFLSLDTGPQFRFGDVTFEQNTFSNSFLEKFVTFKKGDPFNETVLSGFQDELSSSDYFSEVQVVPVVSNAAGLEVPIDAKLTVAKRYQISLGAGYGTDTGLRGWLDWLDRWVNRKGHKMEVDLRLAQVRQNAIWRYTVPLDHPLTNHLDYSLGYLAESTDIETSETYFTEFSYTRAISAHWLQTLYFKVEREHFTVADESATDNLLIPGGTWIYKKAPPQPFANEGIRLIADVSGTSKAVLSSVSYIQARLQPKYIHGISGFGSLILRGDIGATEVDNFQRLPASLRFFTGGDNRIRGYSYKTLGPKNALGLVEGGKYLLIGSIEYVQKVYGKWGAAVFYDIGNSFNTFPPVWKPGAGTGIRWLSPVGPVRLDFAWAIQASPAFHIYVSIGPEI